jgi:hypothetical protein
MMAKKKDKKKAKKAKKAQSSEGVAAPVTSVAQPPSRRGKKS